MATEKEKAYAFAKAIWEASKEYIETPPDDLSPALQALVEQVGGPETRYTPAWDELDPRVQDAVARLFDDDLGHMIHTTCALSAQTDSRIKKIQQTEKEGQHV